MALSNNITACINFAVLVCSIPIAAAGIWLASRQGAECARLIRWPVAVLGSLLILVALAGFVGAYRNRRGLLAVYLFAMATLIAILLALIAFAAVVTSRSREHPAGLGRSYDNYGLASYSGWLQSYVSDSGRWEQIRACLTESDVCRVLAREGAALTADQFFGSDLTPLQSGCCKPPTACSYAFVSPTVWVNPTNPNFNPDYTSWSNEQSQLCFECDSCKAGMLGTLQYQWRKASVALIVAAVALIFFYVIGCSAFKNTETEDLFRRYKQAVVT